MSLLMEWLSVDYGKKSKLEFAISPAPQVSTDVMEPYNSILTTYMTLEHSDCAFMVDGKATYDMLVQPGHRVSHIHQTQSSDWADCVLHHGLPVIRWDPECGSDRTPNQPGAVPPYPPPPGHLRLGHLSQEGLPRAAVRGRDHQCLLRASQSDGRCDPRHGKYMACCMLYRGDVVSKDVCGCRHH